ncbi:alpha-galactosidase A precursor [Aureobasidium subglaciale]|nr:alpha-galactosidase A precursor [Aureobasidium subglaciale]
MSSIQLLDASVDAEDVGDRLILVDRKHIKYITITPGVWDNSAMSFEPWLVAALPPLPQGQWNKAHISSNPSTGTPYFSSATTESLPGLTHIWRTLRIEYLDFQLGLSLRPNVHEATCSQIDDKVVIELARFSWEMQKLDQETRAYRWIRYLGDGPKFLARLTEEGRVIGFAMEHIQDARHAKPGNITLCQQALQRLHRSGMKHGDLNKHNILISNGYATLIDFDNAARNQEANELDAELISLEAQLADRSGRGGIIVGSVDDSDV